MKTFVIVCVVLIALFMLGSRGDYAQRGRCPGIENLTTVVPEEKAFFRGILLNEAAKLNAAGICVLEAGLGPDSGLYYLAVRDHRGGQPYFKRYSERELVDLPP